MSGTIPETVARAAAGEEEAFRMLVDEHGRSVYRLAYRLTSDPHDAEEVVQETFLKVFRKIDTFDGRAKFDTWLYRVASNCAMDLLRGRQRHDERQEPIEDEEGTPRPLSGKEPGPERSAWGGELGERIAAAMETLSDSERAAFTLRHRQGMSIGEIGEVLGLGNSAVKHAVYRAVQKMRQELAPVMGEWR